MSISIKSLKRFTVLFFSFVFLFHFVSNKELRPKNWCQGSTIINDMYVKRSTEWSLWCLIGFAFSLIFSFTGASINRFGVAFQFIDRVVYCFYCRLFRKSAAIEEHSPHYVCCFFLCACYCCCKNLFNNSNKKGAIAHCLHVQWDILGGWTQCDEIMRLTQSHFMIRIFVHTQKLYWDLH